MLVENRRFVAQRVDEPDSRKLRWPTNSRRFSPDAKRRLLASTHDSLEFDPTPTPQNTRFHLASEPLAQTPVLATD